MVNLYLHPTNSAVEGCDRVYLKNYSSRRIEVIDVDAEIGPNKDELVEYASDWVKFCGCWVLVWRLDELICKEINNHYLSCVVGTIFYNQNEDLPIEDKVVVDDVNVTGELFLMQQIEIDWENWDIGDQICCHCDEIRLSGYLNHPYPDGVSVLISDCHRIFKIWNVVLITLLLFKILIIIQ